MAHFSAARRSEAADLAHRIGREFVVQQEALICQAVEAVDHLLGVLRAKRGGADRLRLAAREHRSEEHTSELQSLMRNSYAVFCLRRIMENLQRPGHRAGHRRRYPGYTLGDYSTRLQSLMHVPHSD